MKFMTLCKIQNRLNLTDLLYKELVARLLKFSQRDFCKKLDNCLYRENYEKNRETSDFINSRK